MYFETGFYVKNMGSYYLTCGRYLFDEFNTDKLTANSYKVWGVQLYTVVNNDRVIANVPPQ